MMETSTIAVFGLGFILGLKHATDPDHIVAVTTFLGEERQLRRACKIGAFWGLGHALALSLAGLVVIGLNSDVQVAGRSPRTCSRGNADHFGSAFDRQSP